MPLYWKNLGIVLLVTILTGVFVRPVEEPAWQWVREREPALQLESLQDVLGQGVLVGVFGGFRSMIANLLWIRGQGYWQNRDLPAMQSLINLVLAVDPRPTFFWLNGARILAYDMPHWRIRELGGERNVPEIVQNQVREEHNLLGISLLHRAMAYHPETAAYPIEIGLILSRRMGRTEEGAEYYRRAAEMPGAPPFAARIYAELLRRAERTEEAYVWLMDHIQTLDRTYYERSFQLALSRIREMEEELGIAPQDRFQIDESPPVMEPLP